jgi:hypothetical protein
MKMHGTPSICLGPAGNIQGTYNFLSLVSGLVIKRRRFDELTALDSGIAHVTSLFGKTGVLRSLVFADRRRKPYDWLDNNDQANNLDPTPMAAFPEIHGELPGVLIDCDPQSPDDILPLAMMNQTVTTCRHSSL